MPTSERDGLTPCRRPLARGIRGKRSYLEGPGWREGRWSGGRAGLVGARSSSPRQGPRIVMATITLLTAARPPSGPARRMTGCGSGAGGALRGPSRGRAASITRTRGGIRAVGCSARPRMGSAGTGRCWPGARRWSQRTSRLRSGTRTNTNRRRICSGLNDLMARSGYGFGLAGGSGSPSAIASRMVVSACTFFIR
jgi:hypothetical protein